MYLKRMKKKVIVTKRKRKTKKQIEARMKQRRQEEVDKIHFFLGGEKKGLSKKAEKASKGNIKNLEKPDIYMYIVY